MSNTKTNRDIFNFLLSLSAAQLDVTKDFLSSLETPVEAPNNLVDRLQELRKRKRTGLEAKKTPSYKFKVGDKVVWTGESCFGTLPESWTATPLYIAADLGDGYFDVKIHNVPSATKWPVCWTNLEFASATKKPTAKKKVHFVKKPAVKKKAFAAGDKVWYTEPGKVTLTKFATILRCEKNHSLIKITKNGCEFMCRNCNLKPMD
jgi:hypothetical protein